jgi:hypothetical protein
LGFGFRCGFLGLLHLEIIQERLTREYDLDLITTAPSVVYNIHLTHADPAGVKLLHLHNPADMPDPNRIATIEEPWIEATIYVPDEYLGPILKLCQDRRGIQKNLTYVAGRAQLTYELPLNEVVFDFYDRLKSISRGYASFDYHQIGHREGDLVKMNILVNNEPVDALSMIVHRAAAEARGRHMCERLKDLIPRHLFKIPIQAAIGGKVIARETIAALRKDVTAKCYGGDIRGSGSCWTSRRREEKDAGIWERLDPSRSLHCCPSHGRRVAERIACCAPSAPRAAGARTSRRRRSLRRCGWVKSKHGFQRGPLRLCCRHEQAIAHRVGIRHDRGSGCVRAVAAREGRRVACGPAAECSS